MLHGEIQIGYGLCLNALCCVDDQQNPFTSGKTAGYFIGEIHMAGSINHVERIALSIVGFIFKANCLGLDGDSAFPFQIHIVQYLICHFPFRDC